MSRFNHKTTLTRQGQITRVLIFVISVTILTFFVPRSGHTTYHYSMGEAWHEHTLIATDSFPIYKSEESLAHDRDSLLQNFKPIYEMDPQVAATQLATLESNIRKGGLPLSYRQRRILIEKLSTIYNLGIINSSDYERLMQDGTRGIIVSMNNEGRQRSTQNIYTPKTAYQAIVENADSSEFRNGILQRCDIDQYLVVNLKYDAKHSDLQKQNLEKELVRISGKVQKNQKIVGNGEVVTEEIYNMLRSWELYQGGKMHTTAERVSQMAGQIIYFSILAICLISFYYQFRRDYTHDINTMMLIITLTLTFPILTFLMMRHNTNEILLGVYMIPYSMMPIFMRVFLDSRSAVITHIITILVCSVAVPDPFIFATTQIVAGLTSVYSLRLLSQRSELFFSMLIVTSASLLTYLCFDLINMNFNRNSEIEYHTYIHILIGGFLLLLSYLLLVPFERIFHFTSAVTLVELSNTNNEILQRLSEEAPGTFQHCMQVANLASEVAIKIGAKSQLVRTGAMYHDIGKLYNPAFFTENQSGANPHNQLPYDRSAQIIIEHVKQGLLMADKYKLPKVIKEFIATHHGNSKTKYFYISYKNAHPGEQFNENVFTYPGPNPTTVEQAILMMADAVEAASRSLKEYTEDSISQMVDNIVGSQVTEGYFNQCPITFENISLAKKVFKEKLKTIYHTRISYPELKFPT